MSTTLQALHWLSGLIVLAEALNKLERTCPMSPRLSSCERLVQAVKALGWTLLAMGAGGAVAAPVLLSVGVPTGSPASYLPMLHLDRPTLSEVAVLTGFAILIIRTRLKEGCAMTQKRRVGDAR